MSDKDFKVKNKLVVNGLTGGAGPLVANSNKEIDSVAYLSTLQGGTGITTSPSAGQVLYSAGGTTYNPTTLNTLDVKGASYSADAPSSPVVGQIWVESDTSSDSFDPNIIRRKTFTATAAQTVFTTDLEFIQGYEQVFFNGMLLLRNSDYTTASNTNVTLAVGAAAGDIVEVVSITNLNSINTATTTSNTFTGNQVIQGSVSITGIAESVHNDAAGNAYRIRANASNNNAYLQFANNSASNDWAYVGAISADKMVIRKQTGANTGAYDAWLNINGGPVHIRDVNSDNTEASDWPVPTLSIQSHDTYFENTMFGMFLRDDNPYTLDFSKWVMRLSHGNGDTTSSSSTNLKFGGPGALQLFTGNAQRMSIDNTGVATFTNQLRAPVLSGGTGNSFTLATGAGYYNTGRAGLLLFSGSIAGHNFWDLVLSQLYGGTTVIASVVFGSPSTRTYGAPSGGTTGVQLTGGTSGTYGISFTHIGVN